MVKTPEEQGFTVYYATDVGFIVEDGVPMWKTMEEDVLEPGWHRWFYNSCLDQGRTWASWDESGCDFETTVIRRKKVSIPCADGRCNTRRCTRGSGGSKHMRRSGVSGGSGAGRKWKNYSTWSNSTRKEEILWEKEKIPCEWSSWNRGKMKSHNTWNRGKMKSHNTWNRGKRRSHASGHAGSWKGSVNGWVRGW